MNAPRPRSSSIFLAVALALLAAGCSNDPAYERAINAWADGVCACYRTGSGAECAQKLRAPEFPYRATDNFLDNPDRPADTQARRRALDCENASRAGGSR